MNDNFKNCQFYAQAQAMKTYANGPEVNIGEYYSEEYIQNPVKHPRWNFVRIW